MLLDLDLDQMFATATNGTAAMQEALISVYQAWRTTGRKPTATTVPISCGGCPGWSLQKVASVSPTHIVTRCGCGHVNRRELPAVENEIRAAYTRADGNLPLCRRLAEQKHPAFWAAVSRHRFRDIPKGYKAHGTIYAATLPALDRWTDPTMHDAHRIMLIAERFTDPAPMFQWVDSELFCAIQNSEFPPGDLVELAHRWPHGAFFLPPGALTTPRGAECPFMAFAFVEEGHHTIQGKEKAYFAMVPKLICWTMAPETMESYTAEITLAGTLDEARFNEVRRPGDAAGRAFVREMLRLTVLLNVTAEVTPAIVEDRRLLQTLRKKGRKHRNKPPTLIYAAPTYGLKVPIEATPRTRAARGVPMPPHWRPAWRQRYWKGKKGKAKAVIHWRPAQFINSPDQVNQ